MLAKNEIAKSFGVKTAEAVWEAKAKCPELIALKPDYKKYREYSEAARKIYAKYTDIIEPFGIDECWLDVTGSTLLFGDGETIAHKIRKEIKSNLGITASVGVSFNKTFAKLGSDMKKPDAVTVISKENFRDIVWKLPADNLLFVGKSTADKLQRHGIFTIGDITRCDTTMLIRLLGKNGEQLKRYALGEDTSPVTPPQENDLPKSIGRSVTPNHDITTRDEVKKIFLELSEDISDQLHKKGLFAAGIQIHTRDISLKIKETTRSMENAVNSAILIAKHGMQIFDSVYAWELPLRSVGIRAVSLKDGSFGTQQDMFGITESEAKIEQIEDSVHLLRNKFGIDSIKRGSTI